MSIRLPLRTVLDTDLAGEVGAGSTLGGIAKTFVLPQDTDNVVVKFTASTVGAGASVFFQTSDDGGTTWYDVARSSIVSNANNTIAQWMSIPTISSGVHTGQNKASSILSVGIGAAAASSLGVQEVSGLPIMSQVNRVFFKTEAAVSANALSRIVVKATSQSSR